MTRRTAALLLLVTSLATACKKDAQIACTPGALKSCFGIIVFFLPAANNTTIITIRVQNLQGSIAQDNTAWSQLLYVRMYRNMNPSLAFPSATAITPTWDASVTAIGPGAAGTGWRNSGANSPSFVSEWVATGGMYGTDVGYVAGRDPTYNEVAAVGSGFRTYAGGQEPGWVTFTFLAGQPVTPADVGVQISAWASAQPASGLPVPQQVGCQVIVGGGPVSPSCDFFPYHVP